MQHSIQNAIEILKKGGVVAFPTETVYGLGADAKNEAGLKKIFSVKKRPMNHPLIVHIADISELLIWARDIPSAAYTLGSRFWPGPLTLILKKAPFVSDLVTGGQDTVGLRIPNHPIAYELLKAYGTGLAAPSANRFGKLSPTTASAVLEELKGDVDLILDGDQCMVGVESTIVDVTGMNPVILRPGMISELEISKVLQREILGKKKDAPRVSGSCDSHYAPETPVRLVSSVDQINNGCSEKRLAVLTRSSSNILSSNINCVVMPCDPTAYAHNLYKTLRLLDKENYAVIFVEDVPNDSCWDAIRDRLKKAATLK